MWKKVKKFISRITSYLKDFIDDEMDQMNEYYNYYNYQKGLR